MDDGRRPFPLRSDEALSEEAAARSSPMAAPAFCCLQCGLGAGSSARAKADRPFQLSCLAIARAESCTFPENPLWSTSFTPSACGRNSS